MADLDAELLALAGGDDSSDEESSMPTQPKPTSPPPPSSNNQLRDPESSQDMARKGTSKPVKRSSRRDKRDDSEEGEASSTSSKNSLQSASMSESESDASPPPAGDDGPLFPYEKIFHSAKDKAEIMSKPEIQRESILAEREAQLERLDQDKALRRLLLARERDEAKAVDKKKRKAGAADLEENHRKSSRQKTTLGGRKVGESSDAIEAYKRQREQKGIRDEQRKRDAGSRSKDRKRPGSLDDGYSDADADGESEVEWDDGKYAARRTPSPPKDDPPADLKDLNHARLGRSRFAQVCFYPGFEDAIANCYTRLSIGPDPDHPGQNKYRLCFIKGFSEGKPYAMDGPNGRSFVTKQYATLRYGEAQKDWPFIACSDSNFTEAEFNHYRKTMVHENQKMATKSTVISKIKDINNLIHHVFTDAEITEKLKRQGALNNKFAAYDRVQIENRRKGAIAQGDEAAVAKCDADLAGLSGPKLAFGTTLVKPKASDKPNQQDRLADLNRRNQKLNTENVRKAQIAERRAERAAAAAVARGEALANPFARVKTRAKTHYDVNEAKTHLLPPIAGNLDDLFEGNSDRSRAGTPMSGINTPRKIGTPKRSGTPSSSIRNGESKPKGGLPVIRKRNMDDENIAALDLGIEIDI